MIVGAKERIVWVLVVLFASTVGYFLGQKVAVPEHKAQVAVEVVSEDTDVSNEISKSFGWADAPSNMNVEAVDVVKGVRLGGDDYPHPRPAVKLALKNIGDEDLGSFGINVLVLDEQNKRRVATYGQASGSIKEGWTSGRMLFDATETDWKDLVGTNKIDFPVTMIFYASVTGGDKDILRVVFEPWEIDTLPELSH
ncbi:hypothetical protein SAMN05421830_12045 [Desulfomicrobium norvegicum]|uniref:Uncharacterized protein n=1 Tax=Desulfomicrobium norvegicum (strain DSM 1741 / NCIMB 8310) TaxID=52561 RepID=A0A8G2C6S6_DESNO|nr:hypothetical protein [Desulfomicrobium norvegicum]SFM20472.1 hypothetical protein SAMN05421830_12045 [Desulfomicrobium norvegicum]